MSRKKRIKRTNKHHRLSRSRTGGTPYNGEVNGIPNVILVDYKIHQAFHMLFPDTNPLEIAKVLTETWIDPTYKLVCIKR